MKKLANHIILSGVTVSMLFSPLMAINPNQLPSGGKFTHGTSGKIEIINGNIMNITGTTPDKNSHVIQWGGGFSIGNKAQVNFKGDGQHNYLNIAHGTDKSTIAGLLNAGGNNVFLINPNGVIITKTGNINANRFVASTSSMSDGEMWKFAKSTQAQGASFSPVFKPQKAGNVVNMGNINADDVLLIGNKVSIDGGYINGKHNDNVSGDALKNPSGNTAEKIHLVGNEVYIDKDMAKFNSTSGKVDVTANAIYTQRQMINFANDGYKFGSEIKDKINITNYQNHKGNFNFKKALTIGNMGNEKDNSIEWWHFAKGWNEGLDNIREIDEFRLVDDIDFSGKEGKNYANYCIDGLGCASMIVGVTSAFTKTFDGQDYTLRNINIDTTVDAVVDKPKYVGIFGVSSKGAIFKNINVDYERGINTLNAGYIGGFIGLASDALLSNIYLGNIENITAVTYDGSVLFIGGMIGFIDYSELSNISLDSIKNISGIAHGHSSFVSGLSGYSRGSSISNIFLNNIGNINSRSFAISGHSGSSYASGFIAGIHSSSISNIYLDNIKNISASTLVGGFAGGISNSSISNIYLNNILNIIGIGNDVLSGGFVGDISNSNGDSNFKNIYMFFASGVKIEGEQVGIFFGSSKGTNLNNIHIYHHENDLANATADQSYWGDTNNKIQIHTYNDNNQESVYKDFLSKANIIEKPNHSDISLEEDDLNKEVIGQIIEDITQKGYVVDIAMLEKLLEVYSKFNLNTTESEKIAFIQTYFNIKDENEARGILQSLDFLTYYTKNETFDKNRISNEAKDLFISLQNQSETTLANNKALFSYLNDNKDKLIAEYNKYKELEQIFKDKEQDYFKAQAEFNRLLDLVNKGELSYNDPKFTQAFNNWLNAYNSYSNAYVDAKNINDNIKSTYTKYINETLGYDNFNFNPFLLSLNPDVDKPEFPDIDNSQGGDLPDFEQTASLNLIGDEAVSDDEETEEVEEASLKADSKTCIVSDNYKTMNPCVVGGL